MVLYSGGLDGTYLLWWLSQRKLRKLIAVTIDLGGELEISNIRDLCSSFGAEWQLIDKKEEFADQYVAPSIPAQAYYLNGHPICASLSRPLMAKVAVEFAQTNSIEVVLHSSNLTQNSLRRFNGSLEDLAFTGIYGSPYENSVVSRFEKNEQLFRKTVWRPNKDLYSSDTNLWGREFESGSLDDPEDISVPEGIFSWTKEVTSLKAQEIVLAFEGGIPVCVDGVTGKLSDLIPQLQAKIGAYGIGRYIGLEEIGNGKKVQEIREMPAATLLYDAYRRLESANLPAECIREKIHLEQLWVKEAIEGRWFGLLRESSQAFINKVSSLVSGTIVYTLEWRSFTLRSLRSIKGRYLRSREV
jgi:argininosuccinate synthase